MAEKRLSLEQYKAGIQEGNRSILARAITLVESTRDADERLAHELLDALLPHTGSAYRIAISGIPGAGKSTFINALGSILAQKNKKVAVLAIDPSSSQTGGSLLGDKTRMQEFLSFPHTFVRPTPSSNLLGGVAHKTAETILLCEAAGFEYIFVETVGVGQSETSVYELADIFLLLMISGMGDELQLMKKGIIELADAILIHKADGAGKAAAEKTAHEIRHGLQLLTGSSTQVLACSSKEKSGLDTVVSLLDDFQKNAQANGSWYERRNRHAHQILLKEINYQLQKKFYKDPAIRQKLKNVEAEITAGKTTPQAAAFFLTENFTLIK
jgi:LAO/AO transport system kinase